MSKQTDIQTNKLKDGFGDASQMKIKSHQSVENRTSPFPTGLSRISPKDHPARYLPDILQESTDLIMKIQHDGSVIFWGIQVDQLCFLL